MLVHEIGILLLEKGGWQFPGVMRADVRSRMKHAVDKWVLENVREVSQDEIELAGHCWSR